MVKKKSVQTVVITALSFAILFMSVGFAAYSNTLNINGTASVKSSKWSVHLDSTSYKEVSGSVVATAHTVEDLAATYTVKLTKPGDFYAFTVDVVNDGTFDAELSSITMSNLDNKQKKYLTYEVNYDGNTYTASSTNVGSELATSGKKTATVKVTYVQPASSADLPSDDVTISLTTAFGFDQKNA